MTQAQENAVNKKIQHHLNELYDILTDNMELINNPRIEGTLGYVSQAKAEWEDGNGEPA